MGDTPNDGGEIEPDGDDCPVCSDPFSVVVYGGRPPENAQRICLAEDGGELYIHMMGDIGGDRTAINRREILKGIDDTDP